ncbi:N-acetyllactosaminide beta-1,3-N-acetylglucosaminyltransferase 2 [Brienomyrus brachyistius]|uniref:N-acetyllactosaminide beta-1,3-N-acetylglucosaminyltransferase 2 n=1 Tax=Brienomyrus brachyistius TaxID=42636 RepID=UPI0020B2CF18|nr:N-acetyllactosaminide beta-1,3-N-acetylglucosaminyltransferase 2 [Brienomyrus brachyistius]XP_048853954.1 N-acetyllactosaminide beta-1,3-N-acetylglucosaminyltransferase 2 [Brienomyrus brachyistius]
MARCHSRILCLCLMPCLMVAHLLVYVVVSICIAMSYHQPQLPVRFAATGVSSGSPELAAHPVNPFWSLRLQGGALWNQLQHPLDRQYNPILRGNSTNTSPMPAARAQEQGSRVQQGVPECSPDQRWVSLIRDFSSLPEQMRDFVVSMHCTQYPLLLDQPDLCSHKDGDGEELMLLVAVKSQMGNFENRQAIRQTWGASGWVRGEEGANGGLVRTVFLLGRQDGSTGDHPELGALLELENYRHRDILQWDFRDTFFNLTLKDVLFWRWFSERCPKARFIFKGDDDVFLRTRSLLDFLHQQEATLGAGPNGTDGTRDLVVGEVISNADPNRQPSTKYYIPESFFKGVYPAYAGGGGVVYSGALALRLREVSERVHLFPIDDVYLGMCLHRLGISPTHHPGFLTFDIPEADRGKPCAYRSILLVHKRSPQEILHLWSALQTPPPPC